MSQFFQHNAELAFVQTAFNSPFASNADGAVDGLDFAQFGARFGRTL